MQLTICFYYSVIQDNRLFMTVFAFRTNQKVLVLRQNK